MFKALPKEGENLQMKKFFLLTLTLIGVVALVACDNDNDTTPDPTPDTSEYGYDDNYEDTNIDEIQPEDGVEAPAVDAEFVFSGFENMISIELGMPIEAVHNMLGTPMSTMTMDLLGDESTTESWMGAFSFGTLPTMTTITFTNGYVTSVMETADASSNVNLADYNTIFVGMTEVEIYELLGMPYSVMVMDFIGTLMITVSWINADFTSITITLADGVVSSVLQMGLE